MYNGFVYISVYTQRELARIPPRANHRTITIRTCETGHWISRNEKQWLDGGECKKTYNCVKRLKLGGASLWA